MYSEGLNYDWPDHHGDIFIDTLAFLSHPFLSISINEHINFKHNFLVHMLYFLEKKQNFINCFIFFISFITAILHRTTVDIGQIKIQSVATCLFLCMDQCGTVYGSVSDIKYWHNVCQTTLVVYKKKIYWQHLHFIFCINCHQDLFQSFLLQNKLFYNFITAFLTLCFVYLYKRVSNLNFSFLPYTKTCCTAGYN